MATNWTLAQAVKEILSGNKEAQMDIGKRFPLTALAIAKMGDNEGAKEIIGALPEHITARKIESVLKDGVQESEEDDDVEEVKEKPVKPVKEAKKPAKKAAKKVEEEEDDEDEDNEYSEMSAPELFKLCKKRGLKVAAKQKQAVYIKALLEDDNKEVDDDDNWDDEEEEKPVKKPAKKAAKETKKPVKKAAKEETEDDDDEDWDI